jgi:hypothetical protein
MPSDDFVADVTTLPPRRGQTEHVAAEEQYLATRRKRESSFQILVLESGCHAVDLRSSKAKPAMDSPAGTRKRIGMSFPPDQFRPNTHANSLRVCTTSSESS